MKQETIERTIVGWDANLVILWILFAGFYLFSGVGFGEFLVNGLIFGLLSVVQLFIFSIVCTLGISLIIWIPLGYGVGWIVYKIAGWDRAFHKKLREDAQQPEPKIEASLTTQQQALLNYIKKARTRGMNDERISQALTSEGWTADEMNWAFDALK